MEIRKPAQAGTMESGDVYVTVEPSTAEEPEITLESLVLEQYGHQILQTIRETLEICRVTGVKMTVRDRGALEYAIRSRVETALLRAGEEE
ncbi:citrate lyase acyl carrier protein [Anoxynatronum buryatiense]|uniref:Citrate lyase subunit gamma (Acyl carrier protein) n=1 Tax=Anoxynatronum buryatiense TaxID=489973 RepID=A0AA45WWW2_9CLOT|nr:citrate lyase acyl carrier protein [Anoxynatronum buryatiense]SMP60480.1 citrate lyase subunit gamma (acyl carrier protein) [Anoxynatronum buryatiense]